MLILSLGIPGTSITAVMLSLPSMLHAERRGQLCEDGERDRETHKSMRGRLMSEPPAVPLPLRRLGSSKPQKSSFGQLVRADSRGLNVLKSESDIAEFLVSFGEVSLSREVERLERNQESSPPSPF